MSERKSEHWTTVEYIQYGVAAAVFAAGLMVLTWGNQIIGGGLLGFGVWGLIPSARPLLSKLVDRIPGLPRSDDE